ncbi:MAG: hypothetical protein ABFS09_08850 [Thermodesulfobacteriota bacterium]
MGKIDIRYCFTLNQDHREIIDLRIDDSTLENVNQPAADLPGWANLDFCQCCHCPLDPAIHPYCPVATSLVGVASRFEEIVSYDEVRVTITTKERKVGHRTTAQRAISSLLGLIFATSGCPHTQFFKPMACFHLPLATERDTIFRVAGMYLLGQYFRRTEGKSEDLEFSGLSKIYDNVHEVNMGVADRLRSALNSDSSVNAIISLDMFTKALPFVIEDKLLDLRYIFNSYFSDEFEEILESLPSDVK